MPVFAAKRRNERQGDVILRMLKAKLHRATVTDTDMAYAGSITIDSTLLNAAGIREYEAVLVANVNTGARFETYAIAGKAGSGEIKVNGAAARLAAKGDLLIILCFAHLSEEEAAAFKPRVVLLDGENHIRHSP